MANAVKQVNIVQITNPDGITVDGTNTRYSNAIPMPGGSTSFGWFLQFSSPGSVDVKVEVEVSLDGSTWIDPVNVNGASQGLMTSQINDENVHCINFAPVVAPFARLKLTGQGANDADTKLSLGRMAYAE